MIGQDLVSEKYDNPIFEAETTYENVQKKSDLEQGMNILVLKFYRTLASLEIIFINFIGLSSTNNLESSDFFKQILLKHLVESSLTFNSLNAKGFLWPQIWRLVS